MGKETRIPYASMFIPVPFPSRDLTKPATDMGHKRLARDPIRKKERTEKGKTGLDGASRKFRAKVSLKRGKWRVAILDVKCALYGLLLHRRANSWVCANAFVLH